MSEYIKTYISLEKLEYTIGVTRSRESKNERQPLSKRTNGKQNLHRKAKIEKSESH